MIYIEIPETSVVKQLPFYFAVEEYVAQKYKGDNLFFTWTVEPTVMLGRNQLIENEININYCKENNVHVFRRKSGGGCVYADSGCIQFSCIIDNEDVSSAFCSYIKQVTQTLNNAGIPAEVSGRNDVIVDGKKVAGVAFYRIPNRSVLHNTLLYSTNLEHLNGAITPAGVKLESKGVKSVSQRVSNIGEICGMTIDEFRSFVRKDLCEDKTIKLTKEDLEEISKIEKKLASDEFTYGKNPKYTISKTHRFENVGYFEAYIQVKNDVITNFNLVGDFFLLGDLDNALLTKFKGVKFDRENVAQCLENIDTESIVRGLKKEHLLRLLFGRPPHIKKPEWLKVKLGSKLTYEGTLKVIKNNCLNTICTSGLCPNRAECWAKGTATLMIGGDICTRSCKFCNTKTGKPNALDIEEPKRIALSIKQLGLKHAVITSVDRDDLPDLGAEHWKKTIEETRKLNPNTTIEVLLPDFQGKKNLLDIVLQTHPDVVGHNVETVERLTPHVRSAAKYHQSLDVLKQIAESNTKCKTGIMLGLGETEDEVKTTINEIKETGCEILTIGQYLQPSKEHLTVKEYITPQKFDEYKEYALSKGFKYVESGPMVRSSYHSEEALKEKK